MKNYEKNYDCRHKQRLRKNNCDLCGVQALVNRKINVSSFKCGPDYIDPMFHKTVIGTAAYNLDTYLMSNDAVNYLLNKNSGDIAVIVGRYGFMTAFLLRKRKYARAFGDYRYRCYSCCKLPWYEPVRNGFGERFKEFRKNNIKCVIFNNLPEKLYGNLAEKCRKIGLTPLAFCRISKMCR